jgi:hypothetical protein
VSGYDGNQDAHSTGIVIVVRSKGGPKNALFTSDADGHEW